MRRAREWLTNPWGQARFLWLIGLGYVVWTLLPVALAVLFSFNNGRSISGWQGFSTEWYYGDLNSVWQNDELRGALAQSLKLATLTMLIAVPLGVAFALALDRWRGRSSGSGNFLMMMSFVTPEIALAVALYLAFTQVVKFVGIGTRAQLLGLVTLMLAYPVIIVRARLLSIGKEYEEAAMDLGASPTQALRRVLLPLLSPAIFASFAIVFAATIDDFVIAQQLSATESTQTIPIKIYAAARTGPLPSLNALATITLLTSTLLISFAVAFYRRRTRGERRVEEPARPVALPV